MRRYQNHSVLQNGLQERGCQVLRLNTYDTVPVRGLGDQILAEAHNASVVAIASPSAIEAWSHHMQNDGLDRRKLACIGTVLPVQTVEPCFLGYCPSYTQFLSSK